jgi:DNA-binding HxlR family transcriptional regulator
MLGIRLRISKLLRNPTVRLALFIFSRGEVRYAEMLRHLGSRGTLTLALRELEQDGFVARRITGEARPAQAHYSLTQIGEAITKQLKELKDLLESEAER